MSQAKILAGMGKKAEAAGLMNRYIKLHGQDYSVRRQLAAYYKEIGDAESELVHLEAARDVDPFDRELHGRMAEIYKTAGRLEEAAFALRIALATRLDRDRASQDPTKQGGKAGKGPESEVAFEAQYRLRLAEILLEMGHKVEAAEEASRILKLEKGVPEAVQKRATEIAGS